MKRVLLTGMSGTGKSAVISGLVERGYRAVDTDYHDLSHLVTVPDHELTGVCPGHDWVWREDRIQELLSADDVDLLFLAGCAPNQGRFYPQFDHVILLTAPAAVIAHRLATRTTNPYGKQPDELARTLQLTDTCPACMPVCASAGTSPLPANGTPWPAYPASSTRLGTLSGAGGWAARRALPGNDRATDTRAGRPNDELGNERASAAHPLGWRRLPPRSPSDPWRQTLWRPGSGGRTDNGVGCCPRLRQNPPTRTACRATPAQRNKVFVNIGKLSAVATLALASVLAGVTPALATDDPSAQIIGGHDATEGGYQPRWQSLPGPWSFGVVRCREGSRRSSGIS